MRLLRSLLVGFFALAFAAPALAADDTLTAKNAALTTVTICSKDVGAGVLAACSMPINASGTKINPATSDKQPALGTAGTASADVITVQGIASGTPLIQNQTQINGTAVLAGNGVTGTGSQRVTIASDNTAFSVNLGTIGGASTAALQGAQGTGSTYNPPTGGSGEIGYLSGIYAAVIDTTASSVKFSQTTTDNDVDAACLSGGVACAKDSSVDGLEGQVGIVTETAPASDTASSGLNGRLQRIAQRLTTIESDVDLVETKLDTINTTLGTAVPAGANIIGYTSTAFDVQTTITRPGNATPYTALDVLGGAIDLGVLGSSAATVDITSVQLEADIAAIPAGQTTWVLFLYSVTPPSATADNATYDLPAGDRASFLGSFAISTLVDLGATLAVETSLTTPKQVKLAGTHLFAYLQTVGGFTPAGNSEVYKVTVHTRVR